MLYCIYVKGVHCTLGIFYFIINKTNIYLSQGQYSPSYIACPEVHTWVPIEKCRPKMDAARYCRLEDDLTVGGWRECLQIMISDYNTCILMFYVL